MTKYDKEIYNRAIADVINLICSMEVEYRHEMHENDCMQDDPFSDGILSAIFTITKGVIRLREE